MSTCSMALSMAFCSLSSSTTIASMPRPVWNLISSIACRLVGSETADEQALAALEQRQDAVLGQQLVVDERVPFRGRARPRRGRTAARRILGGRDRDVAGGGAPR